MTRKRGGGKPGRRSESDLHTPAHDLEASSERDDRNDGASRAGTVGSVATRLYVPLVAFLTGASVMIVELAASRVLSPYFGNTLYTWTALIGVIMIALATGYYVGGMIADRAPRTIVLLHLLSGAAAAVIVVPFVALKVTQSLAPEQQAVDIVTGPLTAALLLFALPGCLLGTVTPFAVKLLSLRTDNKRVGASAGLVSGLSTLGSVVGTFASGFVLIPAMSIRAIFIAVGATLALAAAIGYAGVLGSRARSLPAAVVVALGAMLLSYVAWASEEPLEPGTVYQTDTFYHRIQVRRWREFTDRRVIEVSMDRAPEGAQYEGSGELKYEYTRYVRLERVFCPTMERAAFLGGGAYSMPEALADAHADADIEVAEIDPEVANVGRRFFRLGDYAGRVVPITRDARRFLAESRHRYDLIFGDAYHGRQNVPSHMVTREFFDLVRRRLDGDGVFMMNLIGAVQGRSNRLFSSVAATVLDVFPEIYVFAVAPAFPELTQNLILVAPASQLGLSHDEMIRRAGDDRELVQMVRTFIPSRLYDVVSAQVLTDDFNPVEFIIARQLRESD